MQMRAKAERDQKLMRGCLRCLWIDAPEAADEFEIFERGQLVVDHRFVGDPCHDLLGGDGLRKCIDAKDRDRAGVGPQQTCDHPQRRGLASAVGTDQGVELACAHGEIERIDRQAVKTLC